MGMTGTSSSYRTDFSSAHCAWGGHFVACIPVLPGQAIVVLPLVGNEMMIPTNGRTQEIYSAQTS